MVGIRGSLAELYDPDRLASTLGVTGHHVSISREPEKVDRARAAIDVVEVDPPAWVIVDNDLTLR